MCSRFIYCSKRSITMNDTTEIATTSATTMAKLGPAQLLMVAVNKDLDIEKLRELMNMQNEWEAKEARKAFFKAMAKFQGLCPTIKKSKKGGSFGGGTAWKYADMGDVQKQTGKIITKCGLSYRFEQTKDKNVISITCIVSHLDGHSEKVTMSGEISTNTKINLLQNQSTTVSYLTRYTFLGSFGIATADEDMDGRLPEEFKEKVPESYPQERFDANYPKWMNAIRDGGDVEELITQLNSRAPLTKAQESQIRNIK